jgi:TolB-like protein
VPAGRKGAEDALFGLLTNNGILPGQIADRGMGNFLIELKRRHIYRVAAAYAVVAWVLLQVVNNVAPILDLPPWIARAFLLLLVIGFPVAILFAWMHELAPSDGEPARVTTEKLDWALIGALVVVIALVAFQQLAPTQATVTASQQSGLDAARAAAASLKGAISIAVLPFTNLSDDKQQEFFSDGMTEEITTALAKIPDLRVVARESAFQFKAQNRDIQSIGQQLHATHFIEGSVRKVGDRVRISAQLVKADDGVNVWSDSYDRQLTDVFAIQEDIARAIAASLRMPLGIKPGENLINERTASPQSHENYLRATALVRARVPQSIAEAIRILEETVAREPDFAPAWGLLGTAYHFQLLPNAAVVSGAIEEARPIVKATLAKGRAAAEKAIKLDPKSADGYLALAEMQRDAGDYVPAMDLYQRTLTLDPDHPEALQSYSITLAHLGYHKQALPLRDHLLAVEPFVPAFQGVTARILFGAGQTDAALKILENQRRPSLLLAQIYASQGRYREAADMLVSAANNFQDPDFLKLSSTASRLLRAAPAAAAANDRPELGILDWVYLYVGDPERFLFVYEKGVQMGYQSGGVNGHEWAPAYADIRKTERFKKYIRDAGILAYWRAKGWPEQCHPTTGDDFECN